MDTHEFLRSLTIVLCTAGVTTVVFQKLRQPVVLGYILAGLIVGPHVPIPLVVDRPVVETLSELGVILLMFALGLEFSLRKLIAVAPTAGLTAVIQSSIMIWLGFIAGRAFGWTPRESFFAGAIIAISSTTIIAKAFDEQRIHGRLRELVVGILIVEDLIAVLLMAILTAVSTGGEVSAGTLANSSAKLAAFLIGLVAIGMLVVPRAVRAIVRLGRPETTLVGSIGICFAISLIAQKFGYSVALGAFIAGSLVAESGDEKTIEHLIQPVRDMFAAIFFVSVGLLIEPRLVIEHWVPIVVLTAVVVGGKVVGVSIGAFLTGNGTRTSVQAGMSLAQIGEFSFIIATLGVSLGATRDFLYPIAVAVSALTTLTTPWLIQLSGPVASYVDRKLPAALQTYATLYGSWVEQLRTGPQAKSAGAAARRLGRMLVLDALLLVAIWVGVAVAADDARDFLVARWSWTPELAHWVILLVGVVLTTPIAIGVLRIARRLGVELAGAALPGAEKGRADFAAAPRRALIVTLQLACVLLVGLPVLALIQPFLTGWSAALGLAALLGIVGVLVWRSATNLQGHVRASAQVIVEALATQSRKSPTASVEQALVPVRQLFPGLGEPVPIRLEATSPAVGRTLSQLKVRGVTGATVLAISRGGQGVIVPSAKEELLAGDVLAIAGTHEAVDAATRLLLGRPLEATRDE